MARLRDKSMFPDHSYKLEDLERKCKDDPGTGFTETGHVNKFGIKLGPDRHFDGRAQFVVYYREGMKAFTVLHRGRNTQFVYVVGEPSIRACLDRIEVEAKALNAVFDPDTIDGSADTQDLLNLANHWKQEYLRCQAELMDALPGDC